MKKPKKDDFLYKCTECGNTKTFIEVYGKNEYSLRCFGQNKKGIFECDSKVPIELSETDPDYVLCDECMEQVG